MSKKDFLRITDLSPFAITSLYDLAKQMKSGAYQDRPLKNKTLAMIFAKSSTRTRVSFEVGTYQLGGHALFLSGRDLQLGRGETISDTAKVLSRYVDGIMIRTFKQSDVEELAQEASIPVINGLTDSLHPCQVLSDVFTIWETFGEWKNLIVAWVGDGNNMANSWINAAAHLGFELRLACPPSYEPNQEILEQAREKKKITIQTDPYDAVQGAHVINTDVWVSMNQEQNAQERQFAFRGYQIDSNLMKYAASNVIFLHCLPAHRGEEVSAEVIDGTQSKIFDQAENRLHVQKALMASLMGNKGEQK